MKYLKETQTEFIDKILGMIILEKGLSQNTIISYKKDIILVFNWFKKNNINFLNASELNIIEFFSFLQSKNYKSNSLSRKLSSLKQFYEILKEEKYINNNPLHNLDSFKKVKNLL